MSDATFYLVPRASILASGDSDDFHHVSDDEVVLVAVEALERAERERDEQLEDSERIIAALVRERDEARALLQAATDNAFDAGAKAQGLEDSHRFVAMRKERDEARADVARLREALTTVERTGAPGATIVAQRSSDEHSCSWCRGMVTPCPVVTAREALKGGGK